MRLRKSHGEFRIIDQRSIRSDKDRVHTSAQFMYPFATRRIRDLRFNTVGSGNASVRTRGEFEGDERSAVFHCMQPVFVDRSRRFGCDECNVHSRSPEHIRTTAGVGRGISYGNHDSRDTRVDQCLGAGAGSSDMLARLKRDVRGCTVGEVACEC